MKSLPAFTLCAFGSTGVINNQLYVVGGFTERDQDAGPTAEAYSPSSNQWRVISSMKISMELYDSAVLDNKFYVVNSSSENLVGLVYDPQKDEWVYMAHGLNTGELLCNWLTRFSQTGMLYMSILHRR